MIIKDEEYTEVYYQLYHIVFGAIVSKIYNNKMDAEDIAQEVFLLLLNRFDEVKNPRKWVYQVMNNKLREYLRQKNHKEDDISLILNDVNFTYTNGFKDTRILIQDIMENNIYDHSDQETIFDLITRYDLKFSEVVELTGFSYEKVRYNYYKIQNKVIEELQKNGIEKLEDLL